VIVSDTPKWIDYKTKLGQNRQKFQVAVDSEDIKGEDFLHRQATYSSDMKDLLAEIIRDSQELIGPAPCKYAFCALGSMSTDDMNLFSDVELLLLLESPSAVGWEEVVFKDEQLPPQTLQTAFAPRSNSEPMAAYFKAFFDMINYLVISIGETKTINKGGEQKSGFHLDDQGHPGELRLRGTPTVRRPKRYVLYIF